MYFAEFFLETRLERSNSVLCLKIIELPVLEFCFSQNFSISLIEHLLSESTLQYTLCGKCLKVDPSKINMQLVRDPYYNAIFNQFVKSLSC